jgi:hypothetical protein
MLPSRMWKTMLARGPGSHPAKLAAAFGGTPLLTPSGSLWRNLALPASPLARALARVGVLWYTVRVNR